MQAFRLGRFAIEPTYDHASQNYPTTAILYCNLGTPDAPTPKATRKYLSEFFSDPRVIEIPSILWKPILHGIILRIRPAKSAAKYKSIWLQKGAPLLVHSQTQAQGLQEHLLKKKIHVQVAIAMRYGNPAIAKALDQLKQAGIKRILVICAYPQYCGATTASVMDSIFQWATKQRNVPELRFVKHYHDHPLYIESLANSVKKSWEKQGRGEHLLMSFHGMPERTLLLGDPYHCECQKTGRLLAEKLGLHKEEYSISFQSRFGKAKWLGPSTQQMFHILIKQGVKTLDTICPGFSCDCLETLEEINIEGREDFLKAGGQQLNYIPCLNADTEWLDNLSTIVTEHLQGWETGPSPYEQ
jgi:ferrochelatase